MTVKIHAKAAAVLDAYRKEGLTDRQIVEAVMSSDGSEDGILNYAEYTELLSAIVNGYEAKDTPEVAIRKFYQDAVRGTSVDNRAEQRQAAGTKVMTVEFVLNELGIKIDGIN